MPPAPGPPAWAPTPPRVRWGIGDFFWVLLAEFGAAIVAELAFRAVTGTPIEQSLSSVGVFWVLLPAQVLTAIGVMWAIARSKGRGSFAADFGFGLRWRDWTALLQGVGWQVVFALVLLPLVTLIDVEEPAQDLVQEIEETDATVVWIGIVLWVAILTPVAEELLFRGLLLRALLRRMAPAPAIMLDAAMFGAIHLLGVGSLLDGIPTVVGLTGLGAILAVQALRHDSLGRPILIHTGFNLSVVLLTLAA